MKKITLTMTELEYIFTKLRKHYLHKDIRDVMRILSSIKKHPKVREVEAGKLPSRRTIYNLRHGSA
jgi:hypothetical protein